MLFRSYLKMIGADVTVSVQTMSAQPMLRPADFDIVIVGKKM